MPVTSKTALLARIESTKTTRQANIQQQIEDALAAATVLPVTIEFLMEDIAVVEEVVATYRDAKQEGEEAWAVELSKRPEGRNVVYIVATFS